MDPRPAPWYPGYDTTHPLAEGLDLLAPLWEWQDTHNNSAGIGGNANFPEAFVDLVTGNFAWADRSGGGLFFHSTELGGTPYWPQVTAGQREIHFQHSSIAASSGRYAALVDDGGISFAVVAQHYDTTTNVRHMLSRDLDDHDDFAFLQTRNGSYGPIGWGAGSVTCRINDTAGWPTQAWREGQPHCYMVTIGSDNPFLNTTNLTNASRLYIDGQEFPVQGASGFPSQNQSAVSIGYGSTGYNWRGWIWLVAIWERELSEEEAKIMGTDWWTLIRPPLTLQVDTGAAALKLLALTGVGN